MSTISNSILAARNAILAQNDALAKVGNAANPASGGQVTTNTDKFAGAMREAINQVNDLQQTASDASTAYELGQTTDIASVMMAKQKASVGFEATLQVRNKLLSAYQDIMNMPV
ncbi:MAG: flagellar hook-basal body complex protein FliE [Blastomonas sp.]